MTPWALNNRLLGWFVLVGYVALAASFVRLWGQHGLRRLCDVLLVSGAVVVGYSVLGKEIAILLGYDASFPNVLEGFAVNRNAFAFQLLLAASGGLAFSKVIARGGRWPVLWSLLLGTIFYGIWATQSKTGMIVLLTMLPGALFFNMVDRRLVLGGVICSFALGLALMIVPGLPDWILTSDATHANRHLAFPIFAMTDANVAERWLSMDGGIDLWLKHPVFGAGLGAFANMRLGTDGAILVIHSIPLWVLGEFGSVGFAVVFSLPLVALYTHRRTDLSRLPAHSSYLVFCVYCLMVFGLPHDMSYQRMFWFALGGALAAWTLRGRPFVQNGNC